MKKIVLTCSLLAASTTVPAAQYGMGVGFIENTTLYFPIKTERFMFEPFLSHFKDDSDEPDFYFDRETNELGVGIFLRAQATENVSFYYGGRVSFQEGKSTSSTFDTTFENEATIITPTLGASYSPIPDFSIAIEHRINFLSGKDENLVSTPIPPFFEVAESDKKRTYSETSVIARIFF